jgi:hypothetical protein
MMLHPRVLAVLLAGALAFGGMGPGAVRSAAAADIATPTAAEADQENSTATPSDAPTAAPAAPGAVSAPPSSSVILPILGYTPDTRLFFGASYIRFFYLDQPGPQLRASIFSPFVIYTFDNQILAFLGTELYWDRGRNHAAVVPSFVKFPDQFYGIGRDAVADDQEDYTPEALGLELLLERQVWSQLRLGVAYRADRHRLTEVESDGRLATGAIPGTTTGTLSAPGILATWDSRDSVWSARRGAYVLAGVRFYAEAFGSDYSFTEYLFDGRAFLPLWSTHVLAVQGLITSLDGTVPFYNLAQLGGEGGLRGYRSNRYIDRARAIGRLEYRWNDLWGGLSAALFAGLGDVAPRFEALRLDVAKPSYGFGFRYLLEPQQQLKIRLDFGFGDGDSGFYLTLGEAF